MVSWRGWLASNNGCKPITVIRPAEPLMFPTPLPSDLIPMTFFVDTGTNAELPGSAVKPMVPSKAGLCRVWPVSVPKLKRGNEELKVCTVADAMDVLLDENVQFPNRLVGQARVKLRLVMPTVDNRVTGMLLLCPTCMTVDPIPTSTHSPTVTAKVMELLNGGLPLSVAQMVIKLVLLPSAQAGVQLKMPLVVIVAPAGEEPPRL